MACERKNTIERIFKDSEEYYYVTLWSVIGMDSAPK